MGGDSWAPGGCCDKGKLVGSPLALEALTVWEERGQDKAPHGERSWGPEQAAAICTPCWVWAWALGHPGFLILSVPQDKTGAGGLPCRSSG